MSNSPLATYKKISPNRTCPRNHEIDTISIHCAVIQATAKQILNLSHFTKFDNVNGASCNYAVGCDGSIGIGVDEKDRSWCTSSRSNDHRAITIEVASDTKHPYAVTDAAMEALIELIVDICKRNNIKKLLWKGDKNLIGQVNKQNMTVHRWFANKACPGDYLYNKHSYIASEVNKKLGVKFTTSSKKSTKKSTKKGSTCTVTMKVLQKGSTGAQVKALQILLIGYGYSCGRAGADGDFGTGTVSAVKKYQRAKGLTVDGVVGKNTWLKLLSAA